MNTNKRTYGLKHSNAFYIAIFVIKFSLNSRTLFNGGTSAQLISGKVVILIKYLIPINVTVAIRPLIPLE